MSHIQRKQLKNGKKSYRVYIKHVGQKTITKQFRRLEDARTWVRELDTNNEAMDAYPDKDARKWTLAQLINAYILDYIGKDKDISRLTWWKEEIGEIRLHQITPALVKSKLKKLGNDPITTGGKSIGSKRSPATINRYQQQLSTVLTYAVREYLMFKNPIRSMPKLTEPRGRVRYLSNVERTALLEACKQSYWKGLYLVVSIALSTGARRSEIMNLKWNDIVDGRAVLEKTKNGERRTLPFIQSVQDQLKEWGKVRRLDTDLLFPSDNDPKRPRNFTSAWKTATKKAKLVDFRFHDLRHSCASYLAMNGSSPLEIADVLGHSTLEMVKRYSHLSSDHKAKLLEDVMGKLV